MKANERLRLVKLYHQLYTRHYTDEGYMCFYCNDYASVLDHVPALSIVDKIGSKPLMDAKYPFSLVPCCDECNRYLSDRHLLDVEARLEYLLKKYNKLYDKRIIWSKDEIADMGEFFQQSIKARKTRDDDLIHKIRFIEQRLLRPWTFPSLSDH